MAALKIHNTMSCNAQTHMGLAYLNRPRCKTAVPPTRPIILLTPLRSVPLSRLVTSAAAAAASPLALLLLALLHEIDAFLDAARQLWQHLVVVFLLQVVHGAQGQELLNPRPP